MESRGNYWRLLGDYWRLLGDYTGDYWENTGDELFDKVLDMYSQAVLHSMCILSQRGQQRLLEITGEYWRLQKITGDYIAA